MFGTVRCIAPAISTFASYVIMPLMEKSPIPKPIATLDYLSSHLCLEDRVALAFAGAVMGVVTAGLAFKGTYQLLTCEFRQAGANLGMAMLTVQTPLLLWALASH